MTPVTPVIPAEAQAYDALALVLQAAGNPLLGDMALHEGVVASGAPTSVQDLALFTARGDQSWRRSWCLFLDPGGGGPMPGGGTYPAPAPGTPGNAGQERFIQATDGESGTIRWAPPLAYVPNAGDRYILFRDYRWAQWLKWLNETARNIHYPLDVYVAYSDGDTLRYPVPDPIKRAGWLSEVLIGPATVAYTSPEARSVRWYHVNPSNVQGDLYLVLSKPLSQSQQILFRARPPFAYETGTPYTQMHSVLWASGQDPLTGDPALTPPVRLFVLGVTWRSLQQKLTNLTGQPRQLWLQNLERCARQYAQACSEWGVREVGRTLGYEDDWWPYGTVDWSSA